MNRQIFFSTLPYCNHLIDIVCRTIDPSLFFYDFISNVLNRKT